jgi:hypothetical protein
MGAVQGKQTFAFWPMDCMECHAREPAQLIYEGAATLLTQLTLSP